MLPVRYIILLLLILVARAVPARAQINTEQMLRVGQNALYFEDYMLSIQYFNRVITAKPYMAQPYFLRAIAKLNLEDYHGAEADATAALDRNPYLTDAWEVRGVARHNMGLTRLAVQDYNQALTLLPRNRQLMFNKALAQEDINDLAGADSTFEALLHFYPNFDSGYLGRARLSLAQADTTAAMADIDRALSINKNAINGYIMRADVAINREGNFDGALADMNEAIRLQPRVAGLYVNRAYLRYRLDDFFGAMADFDYAIQLDPLNEAAIFNRALLEMETAANDRALADLDRLIELDPGNTRAYYNRAIVNSLKARYAKAVDDISKVIDEVPDLPDPYFMRSQFYYEMKDMRRAEHDYNKAIALSKKAQSAADTFDGGAIAPGTSAEKTDKATDTDEAHRARSSAEAARRFASLLTVADNADIHEEYNNTAIRGKVQDRNIQIEPAPWMELSYYSAASDLRTSAYYIKEVDDLNSTRALRFVIKVTPQIPPLDSEGSTRHLQSIDYYNSYIATHTPRPIDYIGRAMDLLTVHDYQAAAKDLDRAIEATPSLAVAYLLRAQVHYHQLQLDGRPTIASAMAGGTAPDAMAAAAVRRKLTDDIFADLDRCLELSPQMAEAWYNKAVAYIVTQDYTSALSCLNRAIDIKPDMGEAWYNRGYVYLRLGDEQQGIANLSRAGQLGILPAYNLIKRISG